MNQMIAYCGLVCTDCPAYIATQASDRAALEDVAARWRKEFDAPGLTAETVICDGCLGATGRKFGHCTECEVRACAMGRGVTNCAYCDDYGCETITGFFGYVPEAKATLDSIRARLAR